MTHRKDAIKNPTMKLKSIASLEEVPIKLNKFYETEWKLKLNFRYVLTEAYSQTLSNI